MKILCVIDSLGSGGAQRQLVELAMGFNAKGHDVSFLTYHYLPFYDHLLKNSGIAITSISEHNYIKRFIKIRIFIRHGKYDALISFLGAPNFICEISGLPCRKWKLIVGERSANPNILISFRLRIYRWFHLFADHVVSNSNENMKLVRSVNPILPKSKCSVIYNMVDFNRWKPSPEYKMRKNGRTNLVVVSRHFYVKNLIGLINALLLLTNDETDKINVVWYGDRITEPYFDGSFVNAKEIIKTNHLEKVISFFPANQDIIKIVQEADVVGLFSLYEGLPNAVVEGMACSKPVICSSISDIPYFLSFDDKLLFDPKDHISICETLRHIIGLNDEELLNIGEWNYRCAKINFEKENIICQYLNLLS